MLASLQEASWSAGLGARALLTFAFTFSVGLAMGLPFMAGLAWLQRDYGTLVPWCVGINGFASVLATILVIPISLWQGYTSVLLWGAGLYGLSAIAACAMGTRRAGA